MKLERNTTSYNPLETTGNSLKDVHTAKRDIIYASVDNGVRFLKTTMCNDVNDAYFSHLKLMHY